MIYAITIAIGFFVIVWNRNWVLYAPADYGEKASVPAFVSQMRGRVFPEANLYQDISTLVKSTISSGRFLDELVSTMPDDADSSSRERLAGLLDRVADRTLERIKDSAFVTVDYAEAMDSSLGVNAAGPEASVVFTYDGFASVDQFMRAIYADIASMSSALLGVLRVSGVSLVDKTSGNMLDLGDGWARRHGMVHDVRPLAVAGIRPGTTLTLRVGRDSAS